MALTKQRRWENSRRCCCARRARASKAAPMRSCATSSPSACLVCPETSASTRTCRSTRSRRGGARKRERDNQMNFDDTPQEAAFRTDARKWIDANAPKEYQAELSKASLGRIKLQKADVVEVGKAWQKKKSDAGWSCLHWPKEYGGRGATPIERVIWQQEEGIYGKLTS